MNTQVNEVKLKHDFDSLDKKKKGKITKKEIRKYFRKKGKKISDSEIKEMIKNIDVNKDGYIDFNEFQTIFTGAIKY